MKKLWVLYVLGFAAFLLTPVPASAQNANNFTVTSFDADYALTRDQDKRSHLGITETIVAEFPTSNQNHGIERALPKKYNGHTLGLKVLSVKDQSGHNWKYETSTQNDNEVLRIGDADKYVHGQQTYVISYSYNDAIRVLADHDELRWNTNGVQWQQPFLSLNARVHMDEALAQAATSKSCVYGGLAAQNPCSITEQNGVTTFSVPRALQAGENLTYQIDFASGTFADYKDPAIVASVKKARYVIATLLAVGFVTVVLLSRRMSIKFGRPIGDKGLIVPEYLPPKQVSVSESAAILSKSVGPATTAQIIDLAVRHYIKIYELPAEGIFNKKTPYRLEVTKPIDDLLQGEKTFMAALFGIPKIGTTVEIKASDTTLAQKLQAQFSITKDQVYSSNYYVQTNNKKPYYLAFLAILLVWVCLFFASIALVDYAQAYAVVGCIIAGIGGAYALLCIARLATLKQLSTEGTALRNYLYGLRDYMEIAEAERLKVLQSPQGAEKKPVNTDDPALLVKLYERVLPYAVVMGIEKDWAKQMALYYTEATSPNWYSGTSTFQAAAFATAISSFSGSMNTYSSPSSSSGSSSSGSGSGGGGGGGGGW